LIRYQEYFSQNEIVEASENNRMQEDASQHTINNGETLTEGGRLDNVEIQARANSMVRDPEAE